MTLTALDHATTLLRSRAGLKAEPASRARLERLLHESADLAGIPGISIPCGQTNGKLPIGLQILGRHFDEATILRIAHAYEQATEWHKRKAEL